MSPLQFIEPKLRSIVGFLHDEIILEVEEGCDYEHEMAMVSQIMKESMKDVIPSMPVGCEVRHRRSMPM